MASFNRVIMMGNLTRDPELKQLSSGQSVCRLSLASNRQFKNKQNGETIQEVCFIDVDVWGAQAESCNRYLQKGRSILVEGRLKLDTWEDNGQKRSKHSIVADRITFLASSAQSSEDVDEETDSSSTNNNLELKKTKVLKSAKVFKKAVESNENQPESGEIAFADQKPFEDDLPF